MAKKPNRTTHFREQGLAKLQSETPNRTTRQAMADVAVDNLVGVLVHGQARTPLNPQVLADR